MGLIMRRLDENAMSIGDIAFGVFALFVIITGIAYVALLSSQQPPITDSYGNSASNITNSSQGLVTNMTGIEEGSAIPLLLVASAIFICAVLFIAWLASKSGIHV